MKRVEGSVLIAMVDFFYLDLGEGNFFQRKLERLLALG